MSDMLESSLPLLYRGKGKDLRVIPGRPELLLQVCRDTLSTHNVVHLTEIPGKGALIAAQTLFFHLQVFDGIPNHIEEFGRDIYSVLPSGPYPDDLHHRALVVRRARKPDVEFVIRAFLTGSLKDALKADGVDPYGLRLNPDLPPMFRFPEPVFTPTEKSATDAPLLARDVRRRYPQETEIAFKAFEQAQKHLYHRGIMLIDAKFELSDGLLIDDWLNGDCARLAKRSEMKEGQDPPFLDKERFRQIALRKWGSEARVPLAFTESEIEEGLARYHEGFALVAGMDLKEFQERYLDI